MRTFQILISTLTISLGLSFSACSSIDPSPKAIDVNQTLVKMDQTFNLKFDIKGGDSLKDIISKLQATKPDMIFIDKTISNIIFDTTLPAMNPDELRQYLKLTKNKNIIVRKFGEKIYSIEEIVKEDNKNITKKGSYKIPDIEFKINGNFTYGEIFNLMREQGINIYIDLFNKSNDKNAFSYDKIAPEFTGTLKSFLTFIAASERIFVIVEDNGIRLKDVQTVTYNLKLPKVELNTGLSNSSGDSKTTASSGSAIKPIEDLEKQLKDMLQKKANFSLNNSNGTLSVTGDYESIKIADKLVSDFHSIYGKSIKLELHVYEVELSNDRAFGIDYNILKNELVGSSVQQTLNVGTGLSNSLTLSSAMISQSLGQYSGSLTDGDGNVYSKETQSLIFKSLNKFGKTSVITKPTLGTINNLPVKLDIVNTKDYVSNITNTANNAAVAGVDTAVSTSSTIQPQISDIKTGYSLVLHPKTEDDYINVSIKNVSSTLNNLEAYSYGTNGENVIYLKDVSSREFDETVKIKEGEIAIIGGYMYEKKNSLKNGLPYTNESDSPFDALTSAKEKSTKKVEIVITISAKVI